MRCYLRDNTCERKFMFTPWRFDTEERRALTGSLRPDGVFVDIGANVGWYSLFVASQAGPASRILALEPQPDARPPHGSPARRRAARGRAA